MIIYVDENNRTSLLADVIGQGSTSNEISVVATHLATNTLTISFNKPSGTYVSPILMTPATIDGDGQGAWSVRMPLTVSMEGGTVGYVLSFTDASGYVTATPSGNFTIAEGVITTLPEEPDEETYEDILAVLAAVNVNYAQTAEDIEDIEDNATALTARVAQNETDIATKQDDIDGIKTEIGDVFDAITESTLHGKINKNTANITLSRNLLVSHGTAINTNANNIASNDTDITALQGRVTVNEGDIDDLGTEIVTKISEHDNLSTAHLLLRQQIEALEAEIARLDGRGKSYGEIDKTQTELLALGDEYVIGEYINTYLAANFTDYEPALGDLIYTEESSEVNTHEWEYNGSDVWVDNGAYTVEKASNTNYGVVKGGNAYVNIVSGMLEIIKSDYATYVGTESGRFNYASINAILQNLLSLRESVYTKTETYNTTEFEQRFTDLLTLANLQDTQILFDSGTSTTIDNGDTFPMTLLTPYNWVYFRVHSTADDKVAYGFIKPSEAVSGNSVRFLIENKIFAQLARLNGDGEFKVVDDSGTYKDTYVATLQAWGIKLDGIDASEIAYGEETVEDALDDLADDVSDINDTIGTSSDDGTIDPPTLYGIANENTSNIALDHETTTENTANININTVNIAKNTNKITALEQSLTQLNPNNEDRISQEGYGDQSLPVNAVGALQSTINGNTLTNLVENGDFSDGTNDWIFIRNSTHSIADNVLTFLASEANASIIQTSKSVISGHKYAIMVNLKASSTNVQFQFYKTASPYTSVASKYSDGSGTFESICAFGTAGETASDYGLRIIDWGTSGWTSVYAKNIRLIDLNAHGLESLTEAQCDLMTELYFNGTSSSMVGRVRRYSENLCPISEFTGYLYGNSVPVGIKDVFNNNVGKTLRMKHSRESDGTLAINPSYMMIYYSDGTNITINSSSAFTVADTVTQVVFYGSANGTYNRFYDITFVYDTGVIPTYVPYEHQEQFNKPRILNRLPNGTGDIIEGGVLTKKVSDNYTIDGSLISSEAAPPVDYYKVLIANWGSGKNIKFVSQDLFNAIATSDDGDYSISSNSSGATRQLALYSNYTLYVTMEKAKVDLVSGDTSLIRCINYLNLYPITVKFELETYEKEYNITSGILTATPKGTVYYDTAIADCGIYNNGITILNTAFPIKEFDSIFKVNEDMTQTEIDITSATIDGDKEGFTSTALADGDLVAFVYFPDIDTVKGLNELSYLDSKYVMEDTAVAGKFYKKVDTVTNGALVTTLVEVS